MDAADPTLVTTFPFGHAARPGPWILLLVGAAWTLHSVHAAVTQGPDADISRLWRAAQFVRAGVNPYPPARAALESAYGPAAGGRLSRANVQVYAIPRSERHRAAAAVAAPEAAALMDTLGIPEATYPPSANLLLALGIGWLPVKHLAVLWTAVNLLLIGVVVALLTLGPGRLLPGLPPLTVAGLLLVWSPTHDAIRATQFSLLVFACVLTSLRLMRSREFLAGLFLGLALIKPSVAVPFMFLPLVRGHWKVVAVAAGMHLGATVAVGLICGCPPWLLPGQWLAVAGYFTQGMWSLQEVINRAHFDNAPAGMALTCGFLTAALGWCIRNRRASDATLTDFLCFVSVLWTYHRPYDLVVVFIPLARRLVSGSDSTRAAAIGSFLILSIVGSGFLGIWDEPMFRVLGWTARLVLAGWFFGLAREMSRRATVERSLDRFAA
jgi:hypothetical protein